MSFARVVKAEGGKHDPEAVEAAFKYCSKCIKMQRNERSTDGHSHFCRERAIKLLRDVSEFKDEVEKAEERLQNAIARRPEAPVLVDEFKSKTARSFHANGTPPRSSQHIVLVQHVQHLAFPYAFHVCVGATLEA